MPVSLSTTYFSSPRTHFDMPLQYVKGNVCNSVERFERNCSELDEFPTFNIERSKSRHQQNAAFACLPTYSSAFSVNPLNTNSNMPRSIQASNKNLLFSINPSVESRQHLRVQNYDDNNIMVNDYNEFSENLDPNIQCNYCATTTNKLMTAANSIKEIMEQRNQMALELIK